ncbi:MAG: beta-galactosidase [Puia sp.]|nr:beta-galactosidase [Puia sp.]
MRKSSVAMRKSIANMRESSASMTESSVRMRKSSVSIREIRGCIRKGPLAGLLFLSGLFFAHTGGARAQSPTGSNDHIFPAATVAKPFIDFDGKGFLIEGKRVFLVSAGLEYARVPSGLWYDRLLRLKRAGFNCVEIYTFWNFHEPREGQFDFSGDHDLDAFLRMVKDMGMYAIVRVGPYYCAEWDNGGYPLWLRFKEGVRVREDNAAFEKYVDRFFDRLLPIVVRNQVHHGGSVILVQLENEHPKGWGTAMPDGYFRHLREKARSLGIEVPYFFSGLHHASDPAGDQAAQQGGNERLDDSTRPNPWFSTEFWSVSFNGYSSGEKEAREYERRTWKILAHGGNGYNYYMAYGGSNFGYTNNDEDAASYDYGAAVGQAGDLRPIYYSFKRAALFAGSFAEVLANGEDAKARYHPVPIHPGEVGYIPGHGGVLMDVSGNIVLSGDTAIRITARHSLAGELLFLDNPSKAPASVQFAGSQGHLGSPAIPLVLAPGEIVPLVRHFSLDAGITLEGSAARILGVARQAGTTTIVVFGEPGSRGGMEFSVKGMARITDGVVSVTPGGSSGLSARPGRVDLFIAFSSALKPAVYSFIAGNQQVRILAMSRELADRSWFVTGESGSTDIICGPAYAGEIKKEGKSIRIVTERPWGDDREFPVEVFGAGGVRRGEEVAGAGGAREGIRRRGAQRQGVGAADGGAGQAGGRAQEGGSRNMGMGMASPVLSGWQKSAAWSCSAAAYDDGGWKSSEYPLQMGADGDLTADAWYRTKIFVPTSGEYTLQIEGSDRATAFVDGVRSGSGSIKAGELSFQLEAGPHILAIFTAHDGRDKLAAYLGPIDSSDRKGLFGRAVLKKGGPSIHTVSGWHFLRASSSQDVEHCPAPGMAGWADYTIGQDAFSGREGFGWFRARIDSLPAGASKIALSFRSVDENATVFINGHKIGGQDGWNRPFQLVADGIDTIKGDVVLTVFISNYSNEGGIDQPVRVNSLGEAVPVTGWRMRGGPGDPEAIADWKDWDGPGAVPAGGDDKREGDGADKGPAFYRSHFSIPSYGQKGAHPIWRVLTTGMGHGSVWVNGHNLGRYPEKTPAPGLYIPECWLKAGDNTLVIYEEDGNDPGRVSVIAEKAASRDIEVVGLK